MPPVPVIVPLAGLCVYGAAVGVKKVGHEVKRDGEAIIHVFHHKKPAVSPGAPERQ